MEERTMMNLILWLVAGAAIGWLASVVMHTDARRGAIFNIAVDIIGAMIGGIVFGSSTINQNVFNVNALLVSLVGAVVLLAVVNLIRQGAVR
jgi:uncharacterized membrane protein YeaQ/YmgE (transglycosylase-associated protein family)